jgi:hypothetical protein
MRRPRRTAQLAEDGERTFGTSEITQNEMRDHGYQAFGARLWPSLRSREHAPGDGVRQPPPLYITNSHPSSPASMDERNHNGNSKRANLNLSARDNDNVEIVN